MPSLDLTSLEDAINQLEDGLGEAERQMSSELLRDGVIQRFEYGYHAMPLRPPLWNEEGSLRI